MNAEETFFAFHSWVLKGREMNITPEAGARYQTRNGRIVEINEVDENGTGTGFLLEVTPGIPGQKGRWTKEGAYNFDPGMSHHFDLAAKLAVEPKPVVPAARGLNEVASKATR